MELANVSTSNKYNLLGGFSMENNTEQIGIRTTKATKVQFEAVGGSTSGEKLQRLLDVYISVKNLPEGQIIENSIELLDMLKVNLASIEKIVRPTCENKIDKLRAENETLKKELELIKGKYGQLNNEYSKLIMKMELQGIKLK